MAGSKQHFIPRLFLKAFRVNPKGRVAQVRVNRRDKTYLSNVDDVAAERFFYSEISTDGEETLDDVITAYETDLKNDVDILSSSIGPAEAAIAARVVTHLLIRNRHVRGFMRTGISKLAEMIELIFGGEAEIRAVLGAEGTSPSPRFRQLFAEHLATNSIFAALGLPEPVLLSLAYAMLRESSHAGFREMEAAVRGMTSRMRVEGDAMTRNAQVKMLSEFLAPRTRTEVLETLDWRVEQVRGSALILPDFVALGLGDGGECGSLITIAGDDLRVVMMPLAPDTMLVGLKPGATCDVDAFNDLAAPHCLEFFVSAAKSPEYDRLASLIATGLEAQVAGTMEEAAAQFRFQSEHNPLETAPARERRMAHPTEIQLVSNCLDAEDTERVGRVLGMVINLFQDRFDLSRLSVIRVFEVSDAAVFFPGESTSAGDQSDQVTQTASTPSAYTGPVDGDDKSAMGMAIDQEIALGLLDADSAVFGPATAIVSSQLVRIGTGALIDEVFAEGLTTGASPDQILISYALPAWQAFMMESFATSMDSQRADLSKDALLSSLDALRGRLEPIRRAYRTHHDVDRLLTEVLPIVSEVLVHAAAAAAAPADPLGARLAFEVALGQMDYDRWFDLLKADLASIWLDGTEYPSQAAFLVLNRHLERLLAAGAIFLWDDDGKGRVEVPFWSDWEWFAEQLAQR